MARVVAKANAAAVNPAAGTATATLIAIVESVADLPAIRCSGVQLLISFGALAALVSLATRKSSSEALALRPAFAGVCIRFVPDCG